MEKILVSDDFQAKQRLHKLPNIQMYNQPVWWAQKQHNLGLERA